MFGKYHRNFFIAVSMALPLTGCGGSESVTPADSIKLSGPLTLAAVASDATTPEGGIAISDTMASFPPGVLADFASRFPAVSATERYRRITFNGGTAVDEVFGVEGESPDDSSDATSDSDDIEFSADYSLSGNFLSSRSAREIAQVPTAVADALSILYPATTVDELEERTDHNGTITYEVEIEQSDTELELVLDAAGNVLQTTEEIPASQIPSIVISKFQQELSGTGDIEYELITDSVTGAVSFEAELEGQGEGVSILCSDTGEIIAIEYEADL